MTWRSMTGREGNESKLQPEANPSAWCILRNVAAMACRVWLVLGMVAALVALAGGYCALDLAGLALSQASGKDYPALDPAAWPLPCSPRSPDGLHPKWADAPPELWA